MSNGDESDAADAEAFEERLANAREALEAAETETDLDDVEATLDAIAGDVEAADLPEPDDEDEAGPREELEAELSDLRDDLEDARGPYAEDVVETVESAAETVAGTRWTETGEEEVAAAVESFLATEAVAPYADEPASDEPDNLAAALEAVAEAVAGAGIDADDDAAEIAALVEAADGLESDLDAAEEWDDLTVREMLAADDFYDVLEHRKDWPPEWAAVKAYEKAGEVEPILLALERLESNFMEDHCLDALARLGDEAALEPMLERADKREVPAIEVLGKIGSDEAVETLLEYADSDGELGDATLRALGEIGSEEATQAVANRLAADREETRVRAARALGRIGDTRAIDPLADVLADDEVDRVRASAAWALVQIGTEAALEAAADHAEDRAYLVQAEAEKAAGTM